MKLLVQDDGLIFEDLSALQWLFLQRLPEVAAGIGMGHLSKRRLLPDPLDVSAAERARQEGFLKDWREYVHPDLNEHFAEARKMVGLDLAKVATSDSEADFNSESGKLHTLSVPASHVEQWFSCLNQARLLMNEEHRLADAEREFFMAPPDEMNERWLLLAQYTFYGWIQSFLVEYFMQP